MKPHQNSADSEDSIPTYVRCTTLVLRYHPLSHAPHGNRCGNTAWYAELTFNLCTLLAEVALTLRLGIRFVPQPRVDFRDRFRRIYAITMKNVPITIGFAVITTSQLVLGMYAMISAAKDGGKVNLSDRKNYPNSGVRSQPNLSRRYPLTHTTCVCLFHIEPDISLLWPSPSSMVRRDHLTPISRDTDPAKNVHTPDFLVFSLILFLARSSRAVGFELPTLWGVIAKDATVYFLVIFTSHLVLEMTLIFGRVSATGSLPGPRLMTYNLCFTRNRCSLSQLRKSTLLTYPKCIHPHCAVWVSQLVALSCKPYFPLLYSND